VPVLASLPLSGRLVTCPWYWEYHSVEFSVPASVENLELSVPTHLVLTVCKEKSLICIRMSHKKLFFWSNRNKPKHQKHFSKAYCSQEPVLLRRKMGKVDFPLTSWWQQNQARRAEAFEKKNRENNGSEFRKLMKLKKLARYARFGKLKDNSLAVELGGWKHTASEVYRLLTSLTLNHFREFDEQVVSKALPSLKNKNIKNTSRKLYVHKNLFCCAGRWGKWTFHQLPDDNRTKHVSAEAFEKKNQENHFFFGDRRR